MELGIRGRQIDQVVRMRKSRMKLGALRMIEERGDFLTEQWPGEPLHVVLHKNLHRRAVDRAGTLDRPMHPAADRHVSAEEDCRFQIADCRLGPARSFSFFCGFCHQSAICNLKSKIVSGATSASRCCLRLYIRRVYTWV